MKKLTVLMLVVVMVLGLMLIVVIARGPANRATGEVLLQGDEDDIIRVVFDAHEFKDGRPVKGSVYWYRFGVTRLELDVICCKVVGNEAWFATEPTYLHPGVDPKYENQFLVFKVVDGGSPGEGNDALSVEWRPNRDDACNMVELMNDPSGVYNITGGNLVVHFYGE